MILTDVLLAILVILSCAQLYFTVQYEGFNERPQMFKNLPYAANAVMPHMSIPSSTGHEIPDHPYEAYLTKMGRSGQYDNENTV